jgi:hypothetical protein
MEGETQQNFSWVSTRSVIDDELQSYHRALMPMILMKN